MEGDHCINPRKRLDGARKEEDPALENSDIIFANWTGE